MDLELSLILFGVATGTDQVVQLVAVLATDHYNAV